MIDTIFCSINSDYMVSKHRNIRVRVLSSNQFWQPIRWSRYIPITSILSWSSLEAVVDIGSVKFFHRRRFFPVTIHSNRQQLHQVCQRSLFPSRLAMLRHAQLFFLASEFKRRRVGRAWGANHCFNTRLLPRTRHTPMSLSGLLPSLVVTRKFLFCLFFSLAALVF